jgi:hypothetical protein
MKFVASESKTMLLMVSSAYMTVSTWISGLGFSYNALNGVERVHHRVHM